MGFRKWKLNLSATVDTFSICGLNVCLWKYTPCGPRLTRHCISFLSFLL